MIRVAFILENSSQWTGGLVYLQNLIQAVMELPSRKIQPVLITTSAIKDDELKGFEGVEVLRTPLVGRGKVPRAIRRLSERLLGKNAALEMFLRRKQIGIISHSGVLGPKTSIRVIAWLPDFQHVRMREFFSKEELNARNVAFRDTASWADIVLLSSEDARKDLADFAPKAISKSRVLRFVAGMVRGSDPRGAEFLFETYGIKEPYFYLPGQFWIHKNQRLVIDALALLASSGEAPLIVSTGRTSDPRDPGHFRELMRHAEEKGVSSRFQVLGLIPYDHLSVLSREAVALINPSRFEGWSTTVEEAKSMGKMVILSDIPVHREQAPEHAVYVPADDSVAMATALQTALQSWSPGQDARALAAAGAALIARRRAFAESYQKIVLEVAS